MKKLFALVPMAALMVACGGSEAPKAPEGAAAPEAPAAEPAAPAAADSAAPAADAAAPAPEAGAADAAK